ncbi:MAG TPA: 16S rRNA (cytosine(1402)-N(4))-methyltransferase RsmH [Kofleriaceae bacterium]|nr:16S rRNA (cytosine(1402)-N(4))-methyltransferase RsmH [Kofleriaceae bacterium]
MEFTHQPVLSTEVLQLLAPRDGGLYCDCTVGGGGHARRTLQASAPGGRLVGIDRDPAALAAATAALAEFGDRVTLVHDRFGNVAEILGRLGHRQVDGFLVDLGVSSPQLDRPERGFSFSQPGPIDMRMDPTTGETALDLIRSLDVDGLAHILHEYGEERYSRRIAARIKDAARAGALATTRDLAQVVVDAMPPGAERRQRIHPATRTFQALRIAVNQELDELVRFLADFPALLATGGRCLVISFHSLEDRLVKNAFRDLTWSSSLPPDLARAAGERVAPVVEVLTRKPVGPSEAEEAANPRARSAHLRACEKLSN